MNHFAIIGIGCGLASALLFGTVRSFSLISLMIFFLVPLPIYIAGLSHGAVTAAIATAVGAAAIGIGLGATAGGSFLISIGIAPIVLSYLALLSRPAGGNEDPDAQTLEWYPTGRLVLWCAVLAAIVMTVSALLSGINGETIRAMLGEMLEVWQKTRPELKEQLDQSGGVEQWIEFLAGLLPGVSTSILTVVIFANLWIAAKVLETSGHAARPWPPFSDIDFPRTAIIALAACMVLSMLPGDLGLIGRGLSGAFITAFAILGLAVLHHVTRGFPARAFVLATAYFAIFAFNWLAALPLAGLGAAELGFGLRARRSASGSGGSST